MDDLQADATGSGLHGIAFVCGEAPESGGLCHFQNRCWAFRCLRQDITALDFPTECIDSGAGDPFSGEGGNERFHEALAAVSDRADVEFGIGIDPADALCDRRCGFGSGE